MPQSVLDTVNQIEKRNDTAGLVFMNGKKFIMEGGKDDNGFNLEETSDMITIIMRSRE